MIPEVPWEGSCYSIWKAEGFPVWRFQDDGASCARAAKCVFFCDGTPLIPMRMRRKTTTAFLPASRRDSPFDWTWIWQKTRSDLFSVVQSETQSLLVNDFRNPLSCPSPPFPTSSFMVLLLLCTSHNSASSSCERTGPTTVFAQTAPARDPTLSLSLSRGLAAV